MLFMRSVIITLLAWMAATTFVNLAYHRIELGIISILFCNGPYHLMLT